MDKDFEEMRQQMNILKEEVMITSTKYKFFTRKRLNPK